MHEYKNSNFCKGLEGLDLFILTEFFKVFGNPTRIHILLLLMEQDACVGDLANRLGYTQSAISQQLRILKSSKLLKWRRDGKMIFYALADQRVKMMLEKGIEHISQK